MSQYCRGYVNFVSSFLLLVFGPSPSVLHMGCLSTRLLRGTRVSSDPGPTGRGSEDLRRADSPPCPRPEETGTTPLTVRVHEEGPRTRPSSVTGGTLTCLLSHPARSATKSHSRLPHETSDRTQDRADSSTAIKCLAVSRHTRHDSGLGHQPDPQLRSDLPRPRDSGSEPVPASRQLDHRRLGEGLEDLRDFGDRHTPRQETGVPFTHWVV